jgi:hypothetical protein
VNIVDIAFENSLGGIVVCETFDGVYLAQFSLDRSGEVDVECVARFIDEAQLENIDFDDFFSPSYVGSRQIIQDYKITSEIESLIFDYTRKSNTTESIHGEELVCIAIYKSIKNNNYKVAISSDDSSVKNYSIIKDLFVLDKSIATTITKSINSVLSLYTKCSSVFEEVNVIRLAERILNEASIAVGTLPSKLNLDTLDTKTATDGYAELWMAHEVISAINDCATAIVKEKIKKAADNQHWFYQKTFPRKSFNLEQFKSDYPELYEKYSTTSEFTYFTKRRKHGEFPLSDDQIMNSLKAGLNLFSKQIRPNPDEN